MSMLRFFPESWLCTHAVFNEIDGEPMNRYALELHRRDVARKASPAHQAEMAAARAVLNRAVVPPGDSATLSQLIAMFRQREQIGLAKYGTTVDRADLSLRDWLQHALEESMDKSLYLLRAIESAGVPEGWKLVPVKPTREMMDAVVPRSSQDQTGRIQALVWAAMLEAAPEVPRG